MSAVAARVIFDSPSGGARNMAVDQALLMSAEQDGIVTLRLYGWTEPTLSLGYFQKYADRQSHSASLTCPVVRRRSGGGAILHDHELTYSLAIPSSSRWSDENAELYDLVHQVVIQLLGRDGIESQLYKNVALADVPGLLELARKQIDPKEFSQQLSGVLGEALGFGFSPAELTEGELSLAVELENATFGAKEWTQKR